VHRRQHGNGQTPFAFALAATIANQRTKFARGGVQIGWSRLRVVNRRWLRHSGLPRSSLSRLRPARYHTGTARESTAGHRDRGRRFRRFTLWVATAPADSCPQRPKADVRTIIVGPPPKFGGSSPQQDGRLEASAGIAAGEASDRFGSNLPVPGESGKDRNRRVSPVVPRPREGPLTEPTAGAQPRPKERVLMPHSGHWPMASGQARRVET
jgi:hypothetical protein